MTQPNESSANYELEAQLSSCRICLQLCRQSQPFCNCRGTSQYVHETCLIEWAQRTNKFKNKQFEGYFFCDLCNMPIYLQLEKKCTCRQWAEISIQGFNKFLLASTVVLASLSFLCLKAMLDNNMNVGLMALVIFFGLASSTSLSFLIYRLFFYYRNTVKGLKRSLPIPQKNRQKNQVANSHTLQDI